MAYSETEALPRTRADAPAIAHPDFRPDIEGLRGVSVAAVVMFHAFPAAVPGGFIGVDVFFVISGFLITRILIGEARKTGRIDLLGFWARRIRRILPAATLVLLATAALIWLTPAVDARYLGNGMVAAALFYLNWRQAAKAVDYLAAEDGDNPVLHYWSLAVEEQFYLIWPLLLTALLALRRRRVPPRALAGAGIVIAALAALSFAYGAHLTFTNGPLAFFSTCSRAWQFLCGALVAVLGHGSRPLGTAWGNGLSLGCLALLAASFGAIGSASAYPGFLALVPTAAAALLIHAGAGERSWGGTLVALPLLQYVGRISFSLYLWHWPLLVLGRASFGDSLATSCAAIALAVVLATATYLCVESPIRTNRTLMALRGRTYVMGAGLVAAGTLAGLAVRHFSPDVVVIGPGVLRSGEALRDDRPVLYADRCLLRQHELQYEPCVYGARAGTRSVVLMGDSHAASWFPALDAAATAEGWRLIVRAKAACRAVDAKQKLEDGREYAECEAWRKAVLRELRGLKPDLIVVASKSHSFAKKAERRVIAALAAVAPTIVMRDTPRLPESPIVCLRRTRDPAACTWKIDGTKGRKYPRNEAGELPENARILDLNHRICPAGICRAVLDGVVVMTDPHHLSASLSASLAPEFARELKAAGARR